MIDSQQRLIFLHIPKTGGRALRFILARHYPQSATYRLYEMGATQRFQNIPQAERDQYQLLAGHTFYGIHYLLSNNSTYITLLRDPVQHLLSRYYFALTNERHLQHNSRNTMTLDAFIDQERDRFPQTRRIVGMSQEPENDQAPHNPTFLTPREPLPVNALQIAKKHLTEQFSVVGITEEFDLSLLLMRHKLGWPNVHYIERNVNRKRPREFSADVLRRIERVIEVDRELYTFAQGLFKTQIEQFAPQIHDEVVRFRKTNRFYAQLRAPLKAFRSALPFGSGRDDED